MVRITRRAVSAIGVRRLFHNIYPVAVYAKLVAGRPDVERFPCIKNQIGGRSSVGRALRSQCRGRGFDSLRLHCFKS